MAQSRGRPARDRGLTLPPAVSFRLDIDDLIQTRGPEPGTEKVWIHSLMEKSQIDLARMSLYAAYYALYSNLTKSKLSQKFQNRMKVCFSQLDIAGLCSLLRAPAAHECADRNWASAPASLR